MESITENNINYLIINASKDGVINCPFCLEKHTHGIVHLDVMSHRIAHCDKSSLKDVIYILDGKQHFQKNGYFIKLNKQ